MSWCDITLTANAGCIVRMGKCLFLVDALHDRKVEGFSTVSPPLWEQIRRRVEGEPEALLFTHTHFDHFSPVLVEKARAIWPGARLILPEERLPGQRKLSAVWERESLPGVQILFRRLPHQGRAYREVPHYGLVAEHDGRRVLFVGDCALGAPELEELAREAGSLDAAVVTFPWITTHPGRAFVEQKIRPRLLVVNHLPFEEDDCFGYRKAAVRQAGQLDALPVHLLLEPLQTVCLEA